MAYSSSLVLFISPPLFPSGLLPHPVRTYTPTPHTHCTCILLSPLYSSFFALPSWPLYAFLSSVVTPAYTLKSKGWEPGSTNKREYVAFAILDLGYYTTCNIFQFQAFTCNYRHFIVIPAE